MKPLSIKKRRIYLIVFTILYLLLIPFLILYATGYRLSSTFNLTRTGGVFVSVPFSGADVYINNVITRQTRIFQRNVFVQNLKPGSLNFKVEKTGYQTWQKDLGVFPKSVTEAHSFLLPENPTIVEIPPTLEREEVSASSTVSVNLGKGSTVSQKNPEYENVIQMFATTSVPNLKRKLSTNTVNGSIIVTWSGSIDSTPYYFCVNEVCQKEITIKPPTKLKSYDFFPGNDDLIILNLEDGLYVTEIDNRSNQNIQVLLKDKNIDFRVNSGVIYIKKGTDIYYVSM